MGIYKGHPKNQRNPWALNLHTPPPKRPLESWELKKISKPWKPNKNQLTSIPFTPRKPSYYDRSMNNFYNGVQKTLCKQPDFRGINIRASHPPMTHKSHGSRHDQLAFDMGFGDRRRRVTFRKKY